MSEPIDPRIPIQLHVFAKPVYLADRRQPSPTPFLVKELWVGADGSFWVQDRMSKQQTLYWVNGVYNLSMWFNS